MPSKGHVQQMHVGFFLGRLGFFLRDKKDITRGKKKKGIGGVVVLLKPDQASKFCEELIKGVDVYTKKKKHIPEKCKLSQDWKSLLTL